MKTKKTIIKIIVLIVVVLLALALFTGCAKKGKCEECGQYESLNKFVERDGTVHWYCDTCYRFAKLFY